VKAILRDVSEDDLARRRQRGLDRWDEMWEGVLQRPEVFRLAGGQYLAIAADREGWVTSEVLKVSFRRASDDPPRIEIEDLENSNLRAAI
jgi:hypothetical protein